MTKILASRLELEASTILEGIGDQARREHARGVLDDARDTLVEYEAHRPLGALLSEVSDRLAEVRLVLLQLQAKPPSGGGLAATVSQVDPKTWAGIILAIATALGAAAGLEGAMP
jgi:hypothetical protein